MNENIFRMIKFRSLAEDESLPLKNRTFALGNWLRKTSLDELPQLINVVKGDMSLVGPRPLPVDYAPLFSEEQRIRFQVKPGITGLAQVRGGTRLSWTEKFSYDIEYVQNMSFWLDIKIIGQTIGVMVSKKDDGLSEQPFTGNK